MAASAYDPAGASKGQSPEEVKRETGESPVRTRHCEQGVRQSGNATERSGRRMSYEDL